MKVKAKASPHLGDVLPHDLDHVGHGEVHDVVSPGELQDDVWVEQVVALEETRREALVVLLIQEPGQEVLRNVRVVGLRRVLHRILEHNTRTVSQLHIITTTALQLCTVTTPRTISNSASSQLHYYNSTLLQLLQLCSVTTLHHYNFLHRYNSTPSQPHSQNSVYIHKSE